MNSWDGVAIVYGFVAVATLLPVVIPMFREAKRVHGAADFSSPIHFSETARQKWNSYSSTILGTLGSWRKQATIYKRFHYYCVYWTTFSSWLIFLIATILGGGEAKWLIIVVSSHVALALSFHKGLKVPENLRAFRFGECEFYDLNSQLVYRPATLGATENEQLDAYFAAADDIRKKVRFAEAEGLANVEQSENRRA